MSRREFITRGNAEGVELTPGLILRIFASGELGAERLTTCAVAAASGAAIPYHTHPTGESITAIEGAIEMLVAGRCYRLGPLDSMHVPAGIAHAVRNGSAQETALIHTAFPTAAVEREFVEDAFDLVECNATDESCPESLVRFATAREYELGDGTRVRDLFAGRLGAQGICGGYGLFPPGGGLPCHTHDYDESITIIAGRACCQVAGREYDLADCDTACIPAGRPHRFENRSDQPMAMIWVYAGDEPDRVTVDQAQCEGRC